MTLHLLPTVLSTYSVKELFYTLQGEGAQAGRAAVFCRFAGCNLWTGREEDRAQAICRFCDTQFVGTDGPGGGKFTTAEDLAQAIAQAFKGIGPNARPYVVFTGGEPTLQLDRALVDAVHEHGFEIAIETNGTNPVVAGVDWICVSPKEGSTLVQRSGHELKVVVPQAGQDLASFEALDFTHFFVQAMDDADPARKAAHMQAAIEVCLNRPRWRLSVQTHKVIGMP
ncbi:MAG: 7-carboxy-7-deazaguanine synthase [Limnobacter sp.]|uniref:7-carboxy-7-deazaguanine synthase n=1 Tax=Limnobacter sp. TaxID=2003368 RepID=UPI0039188392